MKKLKNVLSAAVLVGGLGLGLVPNPSKGSTQTNNAYLPGNCETPVAFCPGGSTTICTLTPGGQQLLHKDAAGQCTVPAYRN